MRTILLLGLGGLMLLAAAARAFSAPVRLARKAALNMLLGLGSLILVNATTALTGLSLGVNVFNAAVVSVLGVPGLVLLLLLQWVFT
ncbi:MAG: pro-sigmaK processing inhibitor BofA family protein [Oscillospiraceae bacterium]|nr:pro-sigmaK processing inhibitor BofA family protein [Oscillospiraceae bacterium]